MIKEGNELNPKFCNIFLLVAILKKPLRSAQDNSPYVGTFKWIHFWTDIVLAFICRVYSKKLNNFHIIIFSKPSNFGNNVILIKLEIIIGRYYEDFIILDEQCLSEWCQFLFQELIEKEGNGNKRMYYGGYWKGYFMTNNVKMTWWFLYYNLLL